MKSACWCAFYSMRTFFSVRISHLIIYAEKKEKNFTRKRFQMFADRTALFYCFCIAFTAVYIE